MVSGNGDQEVACAWWDEEGGDQRERQTAVLSRDVVQSEVDTGSNVMDVMEVA